VADEYSSSGSDMQPVSSRYLLRAHVDALLSDSQDLWKQTPDRAREVRKLLNGEQKAPIAEGFVKAVSNIEAFRVDTPDKYLMPYHQRNVMSNNPPRVKRWARGDAEPLKIEATKIEQIMQAVMDETYSYRDSMDITLIESVCLAIDLPDTTAYKRTPTIYDKDGKTIKARYQRNASGKAKDEQPDGWRLSKKASAKEHKRDERDYLARHIPLCPTELLGPTAFVPIFGPGLKLYGVLVQRWWSLAELRSKNLWWAGMEATISPGASAVSGQDQGSAATSRMKVTELHAIEEQEDGCHPYVAYFLEDSKTKKQVGLRKVTTAKDGTVTDADAMLCLRCEYGLEQQHFNIEWGQQWAHPEYDKRGMPFPLPFAQSWLAIDAILTGTVAWLWWRGFPTLIEEPNANTPPDVGSLTDTPDDEETTEIAPLSIIRAKGTIKELGSQGPTPIIGEVVRTLKGFNEEQGPPAAAFGGGGESGFQASLARAYADDSMADVKDSGLSLYKKSASVKFELLTRIAEKWGAVPIQRITPVPLGSRAQEGRRKREILDLTEDMAGDIFDLDAEFPPTPNLAKGQQWAEWVQLGLVLLEEFREEIIGDEHPEIFIARRLKQKIMDSPEFQAKVMALVAQLEGDAEQKRQLLALVSGQAEQGTDGMVRPAVQGQMLDQVVAGAPMGQPALTGAGGMPSIGGSALGGVVGGTVGAAMNAAQAGGVVPETVQMGPVG
jgi:hypothetical protein